MSSSDYKYLNRCICCNRFFDTNKSHDGYCSAKCRKEEEQIRKDIHKMEKLREREFAMEKDLVEVEDF